MIEFRCIGNDRPFPLLIDDKCPGIGDDLRPVITTSIADKLASRLVKIGYECRIQRGILTDHLFFSAAPKHVKWPLRGFVTVREFKNKRKVTSKSKR